MKTKLPTEIKTIEQAKDFLKELFDNDESYHPEDDATDIFIFSTAEGHKLNELMEQIYDIYDDEIGSFDPCEYLCDLFQEANKEILN